MRRVVTVMAGLIVIVMMALLICVLWLSWDEADTHVSRNMLSTSDEVFAHQSNSLVSVPGANSADTILILPDTGQMQGAKASLDALSGPHLLSEGRAAQNTVSTWSACAMSSASNCQAWVLHPAFESHTSASMSQRNATGAYRFVDGQPTDATDASAIWFFGLVIEIGCGLWLYTNAERYRTALSGGH